MDINFELYKIFYHAAKYNSFSIAAEKLFISQSAVSQAIKNLEKRIGGTLFYRKSRSMNLTAEGETLFRHIEQAYIAIKTGEKRIFEVQSLNWGEIHIGVGDTICKYYLIPCIEKFNLKYPNIKIQVINRTSTQILQMLKEGNIDFGIATLPVNDESICTNEFLSVEDVFVASDKYSHLKGRKVGLEELTKHPILLLQGNSSTRKNFEAFLNGFSLSVTPEIELESIDLLVEFARIGLGISHVLKESAESYMKSGELFKVEIAEKLPKRSLGVVSMNGIPLSRAALQFINILTESFAHI